MQIQLIDLYPYLSYLVMGDLLLRSLAHHWTTYQRIRRLPPLDEARLKQTIETLPKDPGKWRAALRAHATTHPAGQALLWAVEKPHRIRQPDWQKARLEEEIDGRLADLEADIQRTIAIASPLGFVFTVLGLMLFVFSSRDNLGIQTLLQALGPALGTTALGGIVMVLEKRLQYGPLARQRERMENLGKQLLEALRDRAAIVPARHGTTRISRERPHV